MAYTQRQLHCLDVMGIVAWTRRDAAADVAASATAPASLAVETPAAVPESTGSIADMALMELPFRGAMHTTLGAAESPLLVLVEPVPQGQSQYPFDAIDAKLFDDMLRAIGWRRQMVCLAVLDNQLTAAAGTQHVADVCTTPREAILVLRHDTPVTQDTDALRISIADNVNTHAWQLPHPAALRRSPELKRQAWQVLKAARAELSPL